MRSLVAALLFLSAVTVAPTAEAGPVGDDVVELLDGGFFRGSVIVVDPGNEVVIRLADGRTQTIAWRF